MKKILLIILFCCGTLLATEKQIPLTYNVQLPVLKEAKLERPEKNMPFNLYIRDVLVKLVINKKGKVEKILPFYDSDSLFVRYYEKNINRLKFEPARSEGKKIKFDIVILLRFVPDNPIPDVIVPVDSLYTIDNNLYLKSFESNNYIPPKVKSFPSYFSYEQAEDSLLGYNYMIIQSDIDASGKLSAPKILKSNLPGFNWQMKSALQWSDFSPLKINNEEVASKNYILISFFPYLSYPTNKWILDAGTEKNIIEKLHVRNLIDTLGLLSPPVPAFYPPEKITAANIIGGFSDSTVCLVKVDHLGKIKIKNVGTKNKKFRSILLEIVKKMRMYPALNFNNNQIEFIGLIKFKLDGQGSVLIDYLWF